MNTTWLRCSLMALLLGGLTACRQDMYNQPRAKPLGRSDAFQDGAASRPIPPHTIARGELTEDKVFLTGTLGTNLVETLPMPVTRALLERGQERYNLHCAVCHGRTGVGDGIVVQRGFLEPPSYHLGRLRAAPIGHFIDVMTRGYGVMFSYASRIEPADRWAVAAYMRALQLSRHATLEDVPPAQRASLESRAP